MGELQPCDVLQLILCVLSRHAQQISEHIDGDEDIIPCLWAQRALRMPDGWPRIDWKAFCSCDQTAWCRQSDPHLYESTVGLNTLPA